MTPPDPTTAAPLTVLDSDACHRCAYSLRGLNADAVCPECGTPVHESLALLFRAAPIRYIRQVALGLRLLTLGAFIKIIASLLLILQMFVFDFSLWWALISMAAGFLIGWAGYWVFATPDPLLHADHTRKSMRRFIRPTLVMYSITTMLAVALALFTSHRYQESDAFTSICVVLAVVWAVFSVCLDSASMTYASWMAHRVPDPAFARNTYTLRWAFSLAPIVSQGMTTPLTTPFFIYITMRLRSRMLRCTKQIP